MVRVLPRCARIKRSAAEIVEPSGEADDALRDKAGAPVLGTLLAAQADYLITGYKNLLALAGK